MAMNPKDVMLPNHRRQPTQAVRTRGAEWNSERRTFTHEQLSRALAGFAMKPKEGKA